MNMEFNNILSKENKPIIIAGPCSAESEEQIIKTARELNKNGIKIFRAGIWKPRTKPGGFEGVGIIGLPWLQKVKRETGMLTAVEVATKAHVEAALAFGVDILWIGARTAANPFAMQEIADTLVGHENTIVMIKNPVNPDIELWIGAIERIYNAGIKNIYAVHRGFSTPNNGIYRNFPQWNIPIELKERFPNLPIICDPSHIAGRRDLILSLCQEASDLGFEGLMIESHIDPDTAWSDAKQQVTPKELKDIIDNLAVRHEKVEKDELAELRTQIDDIDNDIIDLLTKRFMVTNKVAMYKKLNNMQILQPERLNSLLKNRVDNGLRKNISKECIKNIFNAIHTESVLKQMEIVKE